MGSNCDSQRDPAISEIGGDIIMRTHPLLSPVYSELGQPSALSNSKLCKFRAQPVARCASELHDNEHCIVKPSAAC